MTDHIGSTSSARRLTALQLVVFAISLAAVASPLGSPLTTPCDELGETTHAVWLPGGVPSEDIGLSFPRTVTGAVVATATTGQLRELVKRNVDFMLLSCDEYAFHVTGAWGKANFSINPTPTHQKVALIADEAAYQMCQSRLSTYEQDVEARFDAEITIYHGTWPTAESLRSFIRNLWQSDGITGVIQVGHLPYALWEFPWNEVCPIPLFHEDMDCTFIDRDHDGKYDWHTWGANDGPELWVAHMRPASGRLSDLLEFLDKCHSYYQGTLPVPKRAEVCICRDWGGCVAPMREALLPIYGDSIFTQGGPGIQVSGQTYLDELTHGYELVNVWVHSSPTFHQFDIAPHQYVYDQEVRAQTPGGVFTVVWGCHGMDWNESPSHCFAESYVFGSHNGLADVGVTRSIGTERTEWLFGLLGQLPSLAEAYFYYLDSLYDPVWIHSQWPSDTTENFVFDCALFGNPFWIPAGRPGIQEAEPRAWTSAHAPVISIVPNPLSERTEIAYYVSAGCEVSLVLFDRAGGQVCCFHRRKEEAGWHRVTWDRRDDLGARLPPGVFFCRLQAGEYQETRKLIVAH